MDIKHKYPALWAPYGDELKKWNALYRALQYKQNHSIVDSSSDAAADDGSEVDILRRTQSFYDRILMAADDAHIREHCRIRNIEHEFCKKVGTL